MSENKLGRICLTIEIEHTCRYSGYLNMRAHQGDTVRLLLKFSLGDLS